MTAILNTPVPLSEGGGAVPRPPLGILKEVKLGKKWTENASERVNFSKLSYPGEEGPIPPKG